MVSRAALSVCSRYSASRLMTSAQKMNWQMSAMIESTLVCKDHVYDVTHGRRDKAHRKYAAKQHRRCILGKRLAYKICKRNGIGQEHGRDE